MLLLAGRPDDIMAMLDDSVTYGHNQATITGGPTTREGVRNFASVESQVLFHHASEALLRLCLAHVVRPPCPWLEVASERPQAFKKHVTSKVIDPPASSPHDDVVYVFLGGPASETGIDEDRWAPQPAPRRWW
jgi:hypothetical protein